MSTSPQKKALWPLSHGDGGDGVAGVRHQGSQTRSPAALWNAQEAETRLSRAGHLLFFALLVSAPHSPSSPIAKTWVGGMACATSAPSAPRRFGEHPCGGCTGEGRGARSNTQNAVIPSRTLPLCGSVCVCVCPRPISPHLNWSSVFFGSAAVGATRDIPSAPADAGRERASRPGRKSDTSVEEGGGGTLMPTLHTPTLDSPLLFLFTRCPPLPPSFPPLPRWLCLLQR